MALKQPFAVKSVLGNNILSLSADPGESFLIKDILIYNPLNAYATLKIEKTTVGYFRVGGPLGSHLPFISGRSKPISPLTAHTHKSITFLAADGVRDIAAADDVQKMRDGAGVAITALEVCTGGAATGAKTVDVPSSSPIQSLSDLTSPQLGMKSLLAFMIERGWIQGFPVAEGETFQITGVAQAGAIQAVIYEIHEKDDMKSDLPNGSKSKEYVFINYGNSGGPINVAGDSLFQTPKTPAEFPAFPYGKTVPPRTTIDFLGILASDFAPLENTDAAFTTTEYLKFFKDREVLWDEDRKGLLFYAPTGVNVGGRDRVGEGWSLCGNYSDVDMRLPFIPITPLSFVSGDEVLVYLTTGKTGAGQAIDIYEQEIGIVELVKRGE